MMAISNNEIDLLKNQNFLKIKRYTKNVWQEHSKSLLFENRMTTNEKMNL
jgi:hypothetical protein